MLVSGVYGSALGLVVAIFFFNIRARREEKLLETELGHVYARCRASTGALLPRIAHV